MSKPKPWQAISDKYADDLVAEYRQGRLDKRRLDVADRLALFFATSLLDIGELVALLRRKPLLEELDPSAYHAILDAIEKAAMATAQMRRNRRTQIGYVVLAVEVWREMIRHPKLSITAAMANVAERRGFKTDAQHRRLKRACLEYYRIHKPEVPKTKPRAPKTATRKKNSSKH